MRCLGCGGRARYDPDMGDWLHVGEDPLIQRQSAVWYSCGNEIYDEFGARMAEREQERLI